MNKKPLIAIVDDDTSYLDFLQILLDSKYRVHSCATLMEAQKYIQNEQPDIMLIDRILPDGDGEDLSREIRKLETMKKTKIIMITSLPMNKNKKDAAKYAGADLYMYKPFSSDDLIEKLDTITPCL
jgi:DNA-binding response OmpR family regulator